MTEAEILEGWRQVRIQQCLHIMRMFGLSIEDIRDTVYHDDMAGTTPKPEIGVNHGYTAKVKNGEKPRG